MANAAQAGGNRLLTGAAWRAVIMHSQVVQRSLHITECCAGQGKVYEPTGKFSYCSWQSVLASQLFKQTISG